MKYDTSFRTIDFDFGTEISKIRYHHFKNWDFQKKLEVESDYFLGFYIEFFSKTFKFFWKAVQEVCYNSYEYDDKVLNSCQAKL